MKVIIIGPYPPPYGGISVHIKRAKLYLERNGIKVILYNESNLKNHGDESYWDRISNIKYISSWKKFMFKVPFLKADVIHFHSADKRIRILLGFYTLLFRKKIILTIHGENLNDQIKESNFITRKLLIESLKIIDKIICVNFKLKKQLVELGINKNKIECIPAYMHPIERYEDKKNIPEFVWNFIKKSKFLITANGCIRIYNHQDLYGIDMLIDLIHEFKKNNVTINLILVLLGENQRNTQEIKYYNTLKKKISDFKLEKILIYEAKDTEFYPILKKSNLFIRPTNTDGDAISVREALYYKIPVIASDIVKRPKDAILFKTRDSVDLYNKTANVIENYKSYKNLMENTIVVDNGEKLMNVYKNSW